MSQTGSAALAAGKGGKGKTPRGKGELLVDTFGLNPEQMSPIERRTAISGYDLRHRIEAMVSAITAKRIKHVYQGDGAATGPGIMLLPRIVAAWLFTIGHVRILLGYTAHEIAHQLFTDFDMLDRLLADETMTKRRRQQVKEFWNAIEDYRIEKLVRRDHPGFHNFINDTREFSAKRFCERVDAGLAGPEVLGNPYRIGSVALTWIGAELNAYVTRQPRAALSLLDPDLLKWVEGWRDEMAAVQTCEEARDLAIRIVDELDDMRENPAEEEPSESAKSDSEGDESGQSGGPSEGGGSGGKKSETPSKKPDDATEKNNAADGSGKKDDRDTRGESSKNNAPSDESATEDADDGANNADSETSDGAQTERNGGEEGGGEEGADAGTQSADPGAQGNDAPASGNRSGGSGRESNPSDQANGGNEATSTADADPADEGSDEKGVSDRESDEAPSRPRIRVRQGDEEHDAEAADLEIDELSAAISSLKGPEAQTPEISEQSDIAGNWEAEDKTRRESITRGQQAYAQIRREVGAPAGRAAGILRRMLMSTARRTWQGGREEGELDFGRVVSMSRGAPDVYRQRQERQAVNTAVYLLLDNSGSMVGDPIRTCQESSVVLDMAIQGTKTNVEITGFTSDFGSKVVLYRYRSFGQKGQAASASLGNMDQVQLGGTPVSTPLLEGWRRLSQQREPRRIMIVVSDGGADYADRDAARRAHDFVVAQGCVVLGIAVGADREMRQWCDNVQSIKSMDDLPVALANLVKEALR